MLLVVVKVIDFIETKYKKKEVVCEDPRWISTVFLFKPSFVSIQCQLSFRPVILAFMSVSLSELMLIHGCIAAHQGAGHGELVGILTSAGYATCYLSRWLFITLCVTRVLQSVSECWYAETSGVGG